MPLSPSFVMDLRTNVTEIADNTYRGLLGNLWWQRVAKVRPSSTKKERLTWLLSTTTIEKIDSNNGRKVLEDLARTTTEYENEAAGTGIRVKVEDLEDHDGGIVGGAGIAAVAQFARDAATQAAYWPQQLVADMIKANAAVSYDGQTLFSAAHKVHPLDDSRGTFANDFTGAPSGTTPGALPIDESVTTEVALANLAKAIAYIRTIKMPNGSQPRGVRISGIMVPPRLAARAVQLTNAKTLVQSAATGALSGDVAAVISYLGLGQPVIADELASAFGGSDTTYYLLAENITDSEMGGIIYSQRQPFEILYNGPETESKLRTANELEWITRGRNAVAPGHPFLIYRVRAA